MAPLGSPQRNWQHARFSGVSSCLSLAASSSALLTLLHVSRSMFASTSSSQTLIFNTESPARIRAAE